MATGYFFFSTTARLNPEVTSGPIPFQNFIIICLNLIYHHSIKSLNSFKHDLHLVSVKRIYIFNNIIDNKKIK